MVTQRISKNYSDIGGGRSHSNLRKFMKIFGFGETVSEGQATAAATATAGGSPEREVVGVTMQVVNDSKRVKDLIQVHTWTPMDVLRDAPAQFYCLDMEDEGIGPVLEWTQSAIRLAFHEDRRIPVIYAIGPNRSLTDSEWDRVNNELVTSGAHFFRRPNYGGSFIDAMTALKDGLAKQYRQLQRTESRQTKENASEGLVSAAKG